MSEDYQVIPTEVEWGREQVLVLSRIHDHILNHYFHNSLKCRQSNTRERISLRVQLISNFPNLFKEVVREQLRKIGQRF